MKRVPRLTAVAFLFAIAAVLATHVQAQQTNTTERTFLTFSAPVEMPGVVLEPGTYEFRLANTQTSRNVVQVLKKDQSEVIGQWNFVQSSRPRVSDETVVMFRESKEGTTPAVQYWYYPGEKIGKEFIYPKDQAERIAARTGQTVKSDDGDVAATASNQSSETAARAEASAPSPSTSAESTVARQDADQDADEVRRNAPASSQPTAAAGSTTGNRGVSAEASAEAPSSGRASAGVQESTQARNDAPEPAASTERESQSRAVGTSGAASASAQDGQGAPAELPRTASPLALAGLLGLLSLVGAAGVRAVRR